MDLKVGDRVSGGPGHLVGEVIEVNDKYRLVHIRFDSKSTGGNQWYSFEEVEYHMANSWKKRGK